MSAPDLPAKMWICAICHGPMAKGETVLRLELSDAATGAPLAFLRGTILLCVPCWDRVQPSPVDVQTMGELGAKTCALAIAVYGARRDARRTQSRNRFPKSGQ